ncbi:LON peptidase N-terminal domain and RING finger protein 3 [Termitomyces sp. J132]|nr:LON peptidase N-terminal domain and RING finger protein 3 [Termitomyces sp. J132]
MAAALAALCVCPVCHRTLAGPTTLHCGHTVCASHQLAPCPVPRCLASPHPAASSVAHYPPLLDSTAVPAPDRVDVTLTKVLDLIARVQRDLCPTNSDPASSSSSRRRPRSADQPNHPRKHPPDTDLLSHLVASSARQRDTHRDQPLLPPDPADPILAKFEKDLLAELTCEICFTLFYDPITTPCQHQQTFCTRCLHRALDHGSTCPLCRKNLPGFLYFQEHPPNHLILSLLLKAFPALYRERGESIEAEERDARLDTPIFVCQLSFPGMPTLLHFFEPRYRLMLRRCLESPNPSFGMVMPSKGGLSPHLDYGTMLEIRSVQMQPDGRSYVETWGTYRFRILELGTLDGYMVGRIERIDDYPEIIDADQAVIPSSLPNHPSNSALMAQCRSFLDQLQRGTAPWIVQRLSSTYGSMPTDVSSFSYWVASILPIDDHEKAKLLPIRSPRLRLLLVVHWIEQLNNNWYNVFYSTRVVTRGLLLIAILFFFCPIIYPPNRWFSNGCGIV